MKSRVRFFQEHDVLSDAFSSVLEVSDDDERL